MTEPKPLSDLLSDITDASATRRAAEAGRQNDAERPSASPPAKAALSTQVDLLGLDRAHLQQTLSLCRVDDLAVVLAKGGPELAERVYAELDDESARWLKQNVRLLAEPTDNHFASALAGLCATAGRVLAGEIPRRRAPADTTPAPSHPSLQSAAPQDDQPDNQTEPPPAPAPAADPGSAPQRELAMDVGTTPPPPVHEGAEDLLPLLRELLRVGANARPEQLLELATAADEPLLREGLACVAAGLTGDDLEQTLRKLRTEQ
ncbi:MAG: hypothetical protein ACOCZK_07685, partial [Planctomycetota bacterium]